MSNGDSAASSGTKSPREESSSSPIGFSSEIGSCDIRRISRTSSTSISSSSAISSGERLAPEPLDELALDVDDLVQLLDHVHRDPDRPRLVSDRPRDRLSDPPRRVRRELEAAPVVELLDGADEAERPFLDEVEEREAAPEIALRDRDDEAQVRLDHVLLRRHVTSLDELRERHLLVGGQERHLPDLAQVQPQRVERRLDREIELRLDLLLLDGTTGSACGKSLCSTPSWSSIAWSIRYA